MSFFKDIDMQQYLDDLSKRLGETLPLPLIAADDGYDQINTAYWVIENGKLTIAEKKIKSRAKRGRHATNMAFKATGLFGSGDEEYTVDETVAYEDTRTDEYPKTILNRVLVHAGLNAIGLSDNQPVAIVTGLPLKVYSPRTGQVNEKLIEAKGRNMMTPVHIGVDRQPSAKIVFHGTYPEAIAGIADYLIDNNGQLREGKSIEGLRMVLDIGGKTTDMAIIANGQTVMEVETVNLGVSNVRDLLTDLVEDRLEIKLDAPLKDEALYERRVTVFGQNEDVSDLWQSAVKDVLGQIFAHADKLRNKHPSLREMICIGGGAALGEEVIREQYPQVVIVDNPDGANARGFLKFASLEDLADILANVPPVESTNKALEEAVEATPSA